MVMSGEEYHYIEAWPAATLDVTGAGDLYAAGFLFATHRSLLKDCGEWLLVAAKSLEVIGQRLMFLVGSRQNRRSESLRDF